MTRRLDAREGDCGLYRVFLDGVEVTDECVIADDEDGAVMLLKRDDEGQHYPSRYIAGEAATAWQRGTVRVEARD